jgi:hypothetical protein
VAQQENFMTTMMRRPSLTALVKEAMEGTANQVDINTEALFQQAHMEPVEEGGHVKQAAAPAPDVVPTAYVEKMAAALDYLSKQAEEGTNKLEPGKGPGALEVLEATSSEENVDVNMGQAKTQIPMTPAMTSSGVAKDPSNAMAENIDMSHPEQPVDPMGNEKTSAVYQKNLERLGLRKQASAPTNLVAKNMARLGLQKQASAPTNLLARNLSHLGLQKQAEDAINPASIGGGGKTQTGATPPEGASPSEESVPSEPSDVSSQKAMVGSNQAAIDYTKGKAKADPKSDVNKVLVEPALTSATDTVLKDTFDNTGKAGVKISHIRRDLTKTAAAQALLSKIATEAEEEKKTKGGKKEKNSNMAQGYGGGGGGGGSAPPPLTGASAGQIM